MHIVANVCGTCYIAVSYCECVMYVRTYVRTYVCTYVRICVYVYVCREAKFCTLEVLNVYTVCLVESVATS